MTTGDLLRSLEESITEDVKAFEGASEMGVFCVHVSVSRPLKIWISVIAPEKERK